MTHNKDLIVTTISKLYKPLSAKLAVFRHVRFLILHVSIFLLGSARKLRGVDSVKTLVHFRQLFKIRVYYVTRKFRLRL